MCLLPSRMSFVLEHFCWFVIATGRRPRARSLSQAIFEMPDAQARSTAWSTHTRFPRQRGWLPLRFSRPSNANKDEA